MPIVKSVIDSMREVAEKGAESYQGFFVPAEPHQKLFGMLDVPKTEFEDDDTINKAKFIHDTIKGDRKQLRNILVKLGATPIGERRLDRVFRFLQLNQEAREALKYHKLITQEANQIKRKR
jgi:hypothetical protein